MFKKTLDKPDPLAQRLRKIVDVPVQEATYPSVTPGDKRVTPADNRSNRKLTFRTASLALITGEQIEVVVKNVSDTGARIDFIRDVRLPDRVLLTEPTLRLKTWAYVIWQTRGAAGLQFVKA